jgi:hypothetical protein
VPLHLMVVDRDARGRWRAAREVSVDPFSLDVYPFEGLLTSRALISKISRTVDEMLAEHHPPERRVRPAPPPPGVFLARTALPGNRTDRLADPTRDDRGRYDAYPDRTEPATRPERPRRRLWSRDTDNPGQAIVEMALVLPILLFVLLGFAEVGFLFAARDRYQNGVDVLTELAAADRSDAWRNKVQSEDDRVGCHDGQPDVTYPDGGQAPGSRIRLVWTCHYRPVFVPMLNVAVAVESEALIAGSTSGPAAPAPSPSP